MIASQIYHGTLHYHGDRCIKKNLWYYVTQKQLQGNTIISSKKLTCSDNILSNLNPHSFAFIVIMHFLIIMGVLVFLMLPKVKYTQEHTHTHSHKY